MLLDVMQGVRFRYSVNWSCAGENTSFPSNRARHIASHSKTLFRRVSSHLSPEECYRGYGAVKENSYGCRRIGWGGRGVEEGKKRPGVKILLIL